MELNIQSSAVENLVALISVSNDGKALTVADVEFGAPVEFDGGEGLDTSVTATAAESSALYVGSQTFNYNRLSLGVNAAYPGVDAQLANVAEDATSADLLAAAVTLLGFIAAEVEAGAMVLPVGDTGGSLIINAVEGSLVYTGQITVALLPIDQREDLSEAFAVQDLEALSAPAQE